MPEPVSRRYATVDIDDVAPMPGNARIGDRTTLQRSVSQHGQFDDLIVQESTGHIIAGNNTWHALKEQDATQVAVMYLDVSDEQARRLNLVHNRTNDKASYDKDALAAMLDELPDLDGTGYEPGDLDALTALADMDPLSGMDDLDDGRNDQDILDATDRDSWPLIRAKVPPEIYERWSQVDGEDDAERVRVVLDAAGY